MDLDTPVDPRVKVVWIDRRTLNREIALASSRNIDILPFLDEEKAFEEIQVQSASVIAVVTNMTRMGKNGEENNRAGVHFIHALRLFTSMPIFVYSDSVQKSPELRNICTANEKVYVPDSLDELMDSLEILSYPLRDVHPLTKIKANITSLQSGYRQKLAVLVATGAFCPIHRMHVENFNVAKKYLEEKHNFKVVGGLISPSHDTYIEHKLKSANEGFINSFHRVLMCQLATAHSDWIEVDPWESSRSEFKPFKKVSSHVESFLQKKFPNMNIQVIFLCGADLVIRCRMTNLGKQWIVATGRPGWTEKVNTLISNTKKEDQKLYFIETDMEDMSSTKMRAAMKNKEPLDSFTTPNVILYMKKNNLI